MTPAVRIPDAIAAVAAGLSQAGYDLCTNHPGFYSQHLAAILGCRVTSRSERSAFAAAWGASLVGGRAVVTLKNVGLNDAADPFLNASRLGCRGGLVCVVFDDIDVEQSQIRLDSRRYRHPDAVIWLEPTDVANAYAWACEAMELSERYETMVVIRVTNLLLEACGAHPPSCRTRPARRGFLRDPMRWVMHPANVAGLEVLEEERARRIRAWSDARPIDACWPQGEERLHVLVGAQPPSAAPPTAWARLDRYPIPRPLTEAVAAATETVVHEHGDDHARRELATCVVGSRVRAHQLSSSRPNRSYHSRDHLEPIYATLRQLAAGVIVGDIGGHTMDPARTLDACLCYGSSVAVAAGAASVAPEQRIACVTGDGGFAHSGAAGLAEAIDRGVTLVVFVIDNGGCRETGGQQVSLDWPRPQPGVWLEQLSLAPDAPLAPTTLDAWFARGGVTLVRVVEGPGATAPSSDSQPGR